MEELEPEVRCLTMECSFLGTADEFDACMSAYHDMRCPRCSTTNLDTSAVLAADPDYGYGDDNSLQLS